MSALGRKRTLGKDKKESESLFKLSSTRLRRTGIKKVTECVGVFVGLGAVPGGRGSMYSSKRRVLLACPGNAEQSYPQGQDGAYLLAKINELLE